MHDLDLALLVAERPGQLPGVHTIGIAGGGRPDAVLKARCVGQASNDLGRGGADHDPVVAQGAVPVENLGHGRLDAVHEVVDEVLAQGLHITGLVPGHGVQDAVTDLLAALVGGSLEQEAQAIAQVFGQVGLGHEPAAERRLGQRDVGGTGDEGPVEVEEGCCRHGSMFPINRGWV